MVKGQTAIPVSEVAPELGPCRWCGKASVGSVEIEKARWRSDRGVRVMAKAPLEVPACAEHVRILDHQPVDDQ